MNLGEKQNIVSSSIAKCQLISLIYMKMKAQNLNDLITTLAFKFDILKRTSKWYHEFFRVSKPDTFMSGQHQLNQLTSGSSLYKYVNVLFYCLLLRL